MSIVFLDELEVFILFGHSIIEGTRESLSRLGLEYVDVIFAHRHDHNGKHKTCFFSCSFNTKIIYSSHGGNRSSFQLRHRKRLGKRIFTFNIFDL